MDDYFAGLEEQQGFIARTDVLAAGGDDRLIRRLITGRTWTRVRNGAYCSTERWEAFDELERHRRRARAVLHAHGDAVALSHVSGLLMRPGCAIWGVDLSRVHVTRRDGRSGSVEPDVVHHQGAITDHEIELVDGLPVVAEARCLVETVARNRLEPGVVLTDSVFHAGRVTPDAYARVASLTRGRQGSRTVDMTFRLADGRAESAGESRARYLYWSQGLPRPEVQFMVRDVDGRLVGITDLAWPAQRLIVEFDGRIKYGRLLLPGQHPGDVVWQEKRREDDLRRVTGFTVERLTWSDLATPVATARRARERMSGPIGA